MIANATLDAEPVSSGELERIVRRRTGTAIADASQSDGGGLPNLEFVGLQLLDEQVHYAGAMPHERFDDLRVNRGLTEQPRERALRRCAANPAKHGGEPTQSIRAHAIHCLD